MLKIAALALAAATAAQAQSPGQAPAEPSAKPSAQSPALVSSSAWWEKVTVTLTGDGSAQSCKYETSLSAAPANACEVSSGGSALAASSSSKGSKSEVTRITFERRFMPGASTPIDARLEPGDTLLGKQVMALAIDAKGAVEGCRVVATGGDLTPEYGCDEAKTERFETHAAAQRQGFMTVLVYGHEEQVA